MKKLAYLAIAAALIFGIASIYAPPDIRLQVDFQATKPQPPR